MSDSIFSSRPAPGHLRAHAIPRAPKAVVPDLPPVRPSMGVVAIAPRPPVDAVPDLPPVRPSMGVVAIAPRPPVDAVPDLPPLRGDSSTCDVALIRILDAPLAFGMTAREGFMRKEAELRAAFAALPVATQRALHARLSNPRADDEFAVTFHRLTAERRTRLLNFLADARRREALAAAR
jgi:hypothetical protein